VAKEQNFVVDASVVAKWFLTEGNSHLAMELRDGFATGRIGLAVPTLLFYEVVNALRFSGAFSESDLTVASKSLSRYRFSIWGPRGRLLELSAALSLREDLTVYDACYIALAQRISSKVVTEDRELLSKVPQVHPLPRQGRDYLTSSLSRGWHGQAFHASSGLGARRGSHVEAGKDTHPSFDVRT